MDCMAQGMCPRRSLMEYVLPSDANPIATLHTGDMTSDPVILGVVGETWFHVLFPQTGLSGYMRQDLF
jgi:hypothetical protein